MGDISEIKKRAVNTPDNHVGKQRQDLYRYAAVRIKDAINKGFYLEAIAIIESLIADPLESRFSRLLGEDYSYKTLGQLVKKAKTVEIDPILKGLVVIELDKWRNARNASLHEMVKLAEGEVRSWQDRMNALEPIAKEGARLFRKIDVRVNSLRRNKSREALKKSD